jgi:5-methylcytosine-specific restriction enzyme subunit McrC
MTSLFEYGKWEPVEDATGLKSLLQGIWKHGRNIYEALETEEAADAIYQPFLRFDGKKIRANNFVGFIQNGENLVEIYPKVFRDINCQDKSLMLKHIFFWFKYCRKWRFPFNQAALDTQHIEAFPELIIHLIANQFYQTIFNQPLMQYQKVEESLLTPKGSINFGRYLTNSITKGNYHQIECDYDPFLFDNKVNRIVKYCTRLLLGQTRFSENIQLLQETLFILDEVEDVPCNFHDVESVALNVFYQDYELVMNSCKLIISQQIYSSSNYDISQWCLLFPMEYIFEDFIAGFLETHFSKYWHVKYQKSDEYLSNKPRVFNMQHDIFLSSKDGLSRNIIIDTKYKLRDVNFKQDSKKGIEQSDLYQMVSYAYKRGCNEVLLLYPNINESLHEPDTFEINSGFQDSAVVRITAIEVPFWSVQNFHALTVNLTDIFDRTLVFNA